MITVPNKLFSGKQQVAKDLNRRANPSYVLFLGGYIPMSKTILKSHGKVKYQTQVNSEKLFVGLYKILQLTTVGELKKSFSFYPS